MVIRLVLIVASEQLLSDVLPYRVLDRLGVNEGELERIEDLVAARLVVDFDALDHVLNGSLEQFTVGVLLAHLLHFFL